MKDETRNQVVILLVVIINFLFAYKYFARVMPYALMGSIAYSTMVGMVYYFLQKRETKWVESNMLFWGITFLYVSLHVVFFSYIKVAQLNVDRWSVISSFWDVAFNGKYPYSAQSHMGNYPGPLPVYFLLSLPFYLIHEVGYLSLSGFILLAWVLRRYLSHKDSTIALFLLVSSVALFWEISVRSTIVVNAVLFLVYLRWLTHIDLRKTSYFILSAVVGGLLLSTRSIFAFALVVYGVFALKNKVLPFKKLFWWSSLLLATFMITFLPFFLFYFYEFTKLNPFFVQSDTLFPFSYVPILFGVAVIAGLLCKKTPDVFFWTGMVFGAVFSIYAIRLCMIHGPVNAYINSVIDLSYSLFCLPLMLYSLRSDEGKNVFQEAA